MTQVTVAHGERFDGGFKIVATLNENGKFINFELFTVPQEKKLFESNDFREALFHKFSINWYYIARMEGLVIKKR